MGKRSSLYRILTLVSAAAAVICAVYGCFVRAAGSGTTFFAVWLLIAVFFCCLAAAFWTGLWKKAPLALRRIFIAVVCAGLILFAGFQVCAVSHFDDDGGDDLDYIIVLGAQVYKSGPSSVLKYRLDKAAEYLAENSETVCIVSGGMGANEPEPEAVIMAEYLEKKGVTADRIIKEEKSETTAENISNSMKYINSDAAVGIVTNNFHVMRALQTAERQGLENAKGISAGSNKAYLPNNMLREFMAEIKFLIVR